MGLDQRGTRDQIKDLLLDLSEELGGDWKNVGRRLGLREADIQNIDADFKNQREKGVQVLFQWRQSTNMQDLLGTLDEGLRCANRVDLAEDFAPRLQRLVSSCFPPSGPPASILSEEEEELVTCLKSLYKKRSKVPMIPWAGANGKIVTVDLYKVYTNLELLVDIDSPDLPIHFPLKLDQLFTDVRELDGNENEMGNGQERLANSSTRVIARGRTGSGKTTFLLKLSNDWADGKGGPLQDAKAVFLLQLKKLDHRSNLGDAIVDNLTPKKPFTAQFIERFVENNQKAVAVLLDGYDEFKGKGLNQEKCGNIVKMLRNEYLPDVQVIVTTRPGRVGDFMKLGDDITDDYRHLQITGFSSSQIDDYITKIFRSRPQLGVKLLDYLEENHLKTELASLPLMCCAFCQLTKLTDGKDFKDMNTISTLFDKLIKCLLKYHPQSKEQTSPVSTGRSDSEATEDVAHGIDDQIGSELASHLDHNAEATRESVPNRNQVDEDHDLVLQLGRIGLEGFTRSTEEELVFTLQDFTDCRPGAAEVVWRGCKVGLLVRDAETEYRPTLYDDLEINNEGGEGYGHSITFVLKIVQEKLAGLYLASLSNGGEEDRSLFSRYVEGIRTVQRVTDLGNVLMFACGASVDAARVIVGHVVHLLQPEAENITLFMNGKLHYSECQRVQRLMELCMQLNYECQSKGQLNEVLKPVIGLCNRLRLVGISSYVTKSLGYMLEHSQGLPIQSLELIRLHLNSSSEFREFLNTFPGLEETVSNSMNKKRRRKKKTIENPLSEEQRREKLREGVTRGRALPKYLLQRPDDTFLAVLPLWEQVNQMQMSDWNFGPVIEGLKRCPVTELILNGVKADPQDWKGLFDIIENPAFCSLEKLTLSMNGIEDELLAKLVPALGNQSNMTDLKLSGNELGPDFLNAFHSTPPMENLRTLILDKTDMGSEDIEQLGETLDHFPALTKLDIRRNAGSDDTSIGSIIDNLHHCPKLEGLLISLHEVTEKCLSRLKDQVTILSQLKELHLVHTPVPDEVVKCAANLLHMMPNLQDLRISATPPDKTQKQPEKNGKVSQEAANDLSQAVVKAPSLRFLSLLYATFDAKSFIDLLEKCTEANAAQNGLQTLRFSLSCIPGEAEVRKHVRNAEMKFLRIWV